MAMKLIRTQAGDGIFVNLIKDDRFKHDRIAVNFILPLARETATGYALLPFLMQRGYAGCSDFTAFARHRFEKNNCALLWCYDIV